MTHRKRLKIASVAFSVLWGAWMIWSLWPLRPAEIGMLVVGSMLAGLAWHWLYGAWYRWYFARRFFPRRRAS